MSRQRQSKNPALLELVKLHKIKKKDVPIIARSFADLQESQRHVDHWTHRLHRAQRNLNEDLTHFGTQKIDSLPSMDPINTDQIERLLQIGYPSSPSISSSSSDPELDEMPHSMATGCATIGR